MIKVTKISPFTGVFHTKELDITPEQLTSYMNGNLVQVVFPNLNAEDREFLATGTTKEEWDKYMGEEP